MCFRINSQFNAEVTDRRVTNNTWRPWRSAVLRRSVTSALNCELILMYIGSNMCKMCVNNIVFKPYNCILAINALKRMKTHKRDPPLNCRFTETWRSRFCEESSCNKPDLFSNHLKYYIHEGRVCGTAFWKYTFFVENTISFEELYYQLKMRANRSARTLGNAREGLEKLPSPAREILFSLRASACRTLLPREILASLLPCVYRNEPQPCRTVSARLARARAFLAASDR